MQFELPQIQEMHDLTPQQHSIASELVDFIHELDHDVFMPGWQQRAETTELIRQKYGEPDDDFMACVVNMAGEAGNLEVEQRTSLAANLTQSEIEPILSFFGTYAYHDGAYIDDDDCHDYVDKFKLAATNNDGIERAILNIYPNFTDELHMLGIELKVAGVTDVINRAANIENPSQDAELVIFTGEREDESQELNWKPYNELNDILTMAYRYQELKDRNLRPIDPEKLIGILLEASRRCGVI